MIKEFYIEGMRCAHCSQRIQKVLEKIVGVKSVQVDLKDKKAVLVFTSAVPNEIVCTAVERAGYAVTEIKEMS